MTTPLEAPPQPAPPAPPAPSPSPPQLFTQEQVWAAVEKAKAEEKERMFGRIDDVQSALAAQEEKIRVFNEEREARLAGEAEAARKIEEERLAAENENLTLKQRFEKSENEWAQKFAGMAEEMSRRDALLAKERELSDLNSYRLTKITALREPRPDEQHYGIHDAFVDLISGNTQEEIDASIATMVAKTRAIVEEVQQHQDIARTRTPGVSPTAGNIGPIEQQGTQRNYSAEEIAAMPVTSEEFQRLRAAYGIGRSQSNRGLLG